MTTKPYLFGIRYGNSENEPISYKTKQNILPRIQGKTFIVPNFAAICEVMEALKDIYDTPIKRTLRQQRITSFNNFMQLFGLKTVTPAGEFEEEIMVLKNVSINNKTIPS